MTKLIDRNFVVSRIKHNDEVIIPNSDTTLQEGDLLLVVLSLHDESALEAFIGRPVEMNWEAILVEYWLPAPNSTDARSEAYVSEWDTG